MLQQRSSIWRHFDLWLAAAVIVLTGYGILIIRSAVTGAPAFEILPGRQLIFAIAAVVAMVAIAALDYRVLTSSHWYLYLALIISLILVLLLGIITNGSRRAFEIEAIGLQLQPTEIGRILFAITFAQFLAQRQHLIGRLSNTALSLIYVGILIGLIFIEPDLGMSIVFIVVWFVMIFMAGLPLSHFALLAGVGIASTIAILPFLADYQQERLLAFVDASAVPEQAFNVQQAVISIGTGGLFGQGYLQGSQSQLGFLRVQHTDFIFSVLTHELGLVFGSLVVLGLLGFIILRILKVAQMTPDPAGRLICAGIAGVIFFQTLVSVGMNVRLLPVTGLTLPFVSYGGSSLVTVFMAIGVVQSIRMRHRKQEFG